MRRQLALLLAGIASFFLLCGCDAPRRLQAWMDYKRDEGRAIALARGQVAPYSANPNRDRYNAMRDKKGWEVRVDMVHGPDKNGEHYFAFDSYRIVEIDENWRIVGTFGGG